jgi:LuxR family maltose regulon positive regulatory protein
MMLTTIVLVDAQAIFRKGLRLLIDDEDDLRVIGETSDSQAAIELVADLAPDVVVMDISKPGPAGSIEAARQILAAHPLIKIVAFSIHVNKRYVDKMLDAGVVGYLLKESAAEELIDGIRSVSVGEVYLSTAIKEIVVSSYRAYLSNETGVAEREAEAHLDLLLSTKLYQPTITPDLVAREHLIERLERNRQRPLTVISAPGGYGKSVLASSWLDVSGCPSAWVSLDQEDNDLRTFLRYLLAAVFRVFPTLELKTKPLLETPILPPVSVLARYLLNDLALIDEAFILTFDDIHLIQEPTIFDLLGELLRHPAQNMHLVLIGRRDIPLPIASLRARGQVTEIRMQDLRFSVPETALLLEKMVEHPMDAGAAAEWTRKTEGWVTALRLVALSQRHKAQHNDHLADFQEDSQYLQNYLLLEVLSHLPSITQEWLLRTALLDRFCAPLCEEICPDLSAASMSGAEFIRWLQGANMFLVSLDGKGEWFRFHHLFQGFLQNRLEMQTQPEEIAALHTRVSAWYADNDWIDEAIQHSLAAGNGIKAAQIIERNQQSVLNQDNWNLLEKWLSLLPEPIKKGHVRLLLAQAWIYYRKARFSDLLATINTVETRLASGASEDVEAEEIAMGEIAFYKGFFFCFQGNSEQSLKHLEDALEQIPMTHPTLRGEAEDIFGIACHMVKGKDEAVYRLNEWITALPPPHRHRMERLLASLLYSQLISGDLGEAFKVKAQLLEIARKRKDVFALAHTSYLQGVLHFLHHGLAGALTCFQKAAKQRYILFTRTGIDVLAGLALTYQFMGQPEKAKLTLETLFEYAHSQNQPLGLAIAHSTQARLWLLQGDLGPAFLWVDRNPAPVLEPMFWWIENPVITYCRVLLAESSTASLQEAESKLQECLQLNQSHHNTLQMIQILPLLALAYQKQARVDQALSTLECAVTLAQPSSVLSPFVELGLPLAVLLARLKNQGGTRKSEDRQSEVNRSVALAFISQILAAFPEEHQAAAALEASTIRQGYLPPQQGLVNPLTRREFETLQYLAEDLTTQEIAAKMGVKVSTVRKHTHHIYDKLYVHSRYEALQKAGELDLL